MALNRATLSELQAITPDQQVAIDSKNECDIYSYTEKLKLVLILCEQLVIAAHSVSRYVPDLSSSGEQSKFWKENIIPNLVDSLTQDVKARAVMNRAFQSIFSLAITIKEGAEIVKQSKASPKSLEIVKTRIPTALKELEKYIEEISNLRSSAVQPLETQKGNIFKFIGSKAAGIVDDKTNIELQINQSYDKLNEIISNISQKQGELNRFDYLITATEKRLADATKDEEMAKARANELRNLNANVEKTLQGLLTNATENKTGFPFWKWLSVGSQNYNSQNDERKYYESVISARMSRIRGELDDAAAASKIAKQLTEDLSEYKGKYEKLKMEMEVTFKSAKEKMTAIQNDIVNLLKKREQSKNNQIQVEELTGQNGDLLIQCLTIAQAFSLLFGKQSIIYGSLVTILQMITDTVRSDVELLSGTDADIFVAIARLLKTVDFLTRYSSRLDEILTVSGEYPRSIQF